MERFWAKVSKSDGCWLWTGSRNDRGYGNFNNNGRTVQAHRLSYELAMGPIPKGMNVCHRCDSPGCVNPDHLFLGTHLDNMRDRDAKGRRVAPRGEANGFAKLTEAQVIEIRERYIPYKVSLPRLAREYGVHHSTIYDIVRGVTWTRIEGAA
jgi:hypothetical protein